MLDKIVVLLDGSTLAQCVLAHTRSLAHTFQAEVTLLHVLEPKERTEMERLDPLNWHLRKIGAQTYLNAVAQRWEDEKMHPTPMMLEGSAANRIIEYIEETKPDLIMLSSHGRSGFSPWNVSSVAQKTINRTSRSFMLIRAYQHRGLETDEVRYRRILVPLDGSKRAECALPFATRLAAAHEAELLLVHFPVSPIIMHSHMLSPEEIAKIKQITERNQVQADRYLAQMAAQITPNAAASRLSGSSAADALLEFADSNEIDLVVMSAHGHSGETIRPYGSVVSSFIAYGSTSLLVIQDLTQDQIKPTQAELSATTNGGTGLMDRKIAYAQPSDWSKI